MTIYVVRHAKAGSRGEFNGPDWLRPLVANGQAQARGLLPMFEHATFARVVASSYVRCMETMVPVAAHHGVAIEPDDALVEGAPLETTLRLLDKLWDFGAVVCSHGDIIPMVLQHLQAQGTDLGPAPKCEKASTWILNGHFDQGVTATYVAPPAPSRPDFKI